MQPSTLFILTFIFVIMPIGIRMMCNFTYYKSLWLSLILYGAVGALWLILAGVFALA